MTTVGPRAELAARGRPAGGGLRFLVGQYVALTKPRIIELLLITTIPVMFLAAGGVPDLLLVVNTVVGGALSAAAANTFNCYLDRDIDAVMHRTSRRPLVTGTISARSALLFGLALAVVSTLWLGLLVNWLSSGLALAALLFYVFGYTLVLKRRTPQNIVWGGAAGCMPVLVGWAAVTGGVSWTALLLFLVIFFWTPPHYWPLSLRYKRDYATAEVPIWVASQPSESMISRTCSTPRTVSVSAKKSMPPDVTRGASRTSPSTSAGPACLTATWTRAA